MVAGSNAGINRPVVLADRKVFVSPMRDGVRAAGTVEFGGLNLPPTRRRAQLLVKHFAEGFPELASVTNHEPWMGHRPCLPDSLDRQRAVQGKSVSVRVNLGGRRNIK